MWEWAYSGVNNSLPGNGGQECADFLGIQQRLVESIVGSLIACYAMYMAYSKLSVPEVTSLHRSDRCGKRILLVIVCLTFGIELGYKLSTRQMVWILNPCHVTTIMQIYLLSASPSKAVTAVFRLHLHMLTGATMALLFPVVNTRLLPLETEIYFVQHILLLVIPFYLIRIGGVYTTEPMGDINWAVMAFGLLFIYHFIPLQVLGLAWQVNLNNMLCPAISDPFYGPYYRLFGMSHQAILIPTHGKVYTLISSVFKLTLPSELSNDSNCGSRENGTSISKRNGNGEGCVYSGHKKLL